jgi:CheY-like chemotaxis protein
VKKRVLIVDDNRDAAEMLAELLELLGYESRVALEAFSALKIAPEFNPDIMLIDIGLPEVNGYELAQRMRAIPQFASARLMALTGYGQEADRQNAIDAGFDEHLVKPVDVERLQSILADESTSRN